jgi:AI-2 transport protein TqsA
MTDDASKPRFTLEQVRTTCLLVLAVLAVGAALAWLKAVVVPFLVALALYYLLAPVSDWLARRWGLRPGLAAAGSLAIGLVIVVLIGLLVAACLREVTRDAATYTARLNELATNPEVVRVAELLGLNQDPETGRVVLVTAEQGRQLTRAAVGFLQNLLTDTFLVLAFLLFMLLGHRPGPKPGTARAEAMTSEAATRVRRYLTEMFAFSVLTGVLVGLILAVLGVPFSLSFGFLAFVLNFIPTLGPITATLLPAPVVFLDPTLPLWAKVAAVALPAAVQAVIGTVIQPRFQSQTQGVHPVTSMLALVVFGSLWGLVGAVLAIPLIAVLKIAFEKIPGGQPFADLLAGRLDRW